MPIPGLTQTVLPSVITNVTTVSKGASVPGGARVACVIGLGSRSEIVVASANGSGNDGFDPLFTSTTSGTDGRHFALSLASH